MTNSIFMEPVFDEIPEDLRRLPRWVVWKGNKVPYCATSLNGNASVSDPFSWSSFSAAKWAYEEGGYLGVGIVLCGDGPVGIDLDKCVVNRVPDPEAIRLLERIGCQYIELSPSGTGLRSFGYGSLDKGVRGELDGVQVELYANKRYLTVTGQVLQQGSLHKLGGLEDVANAIHGDRVQKATKDYSGNLCKSSVSPPSSSVEIPTSCIPMVEGERNRCLFQLARYYRGIRPNATTQEQREIARNWHSTYEAVVGTKDVAVTLADFLSAWQNVRDPYGAVLAPVIAGIDESCPLPPGMERLGYGKACNRLVRLCVALQKHNGNDPFFISARIAGKHLGVHYCDAAKMLKTLLADLVLELVTRGTGKTASRYRYVWRGYGDFDAM